LKELEFRYNFRAKLDKMLSNKLGGIKLATAKSFKRAFQFEASDLAFDIYRILYKF
jgi:hypothetical protein